MEYVILIHNDYKDTGKEFTNGLKIIEENGKLTLYKAPSGKKLYDPKRVYTNDFSSVYVQISDQKLPDYYSNIAASMESSMKGAMEKILFK